ncbi:MAG: hypothetical protein KGS72_22480 [Cyanobacteria bacterium REEB67]|nr:hypothetical protein [Cyanobacteria bacterium REEB67]
MGFRVGAVLRLNYQLDDELIWRGGECRPSERPAIGNIKTVGYFNCDNPACKSWTDCFPEVQHALVVVKNNRIDSVESYELPEDAEVEEFAILEIE